MSAGALNLLVFREARRRVRGTDLKEKLRDQVAAAGKAFSQDAVLSALLVAGELECGVADAGCSSAVSENVTDHLAEALVGLKAPSQSDLLRLVSAGSVPQEISISVPEGFAYYALHPLAYSDVATKLTDTGNRVAVLGIRSAGTTLSAMVAAGLRQLGKNALRITVRPQGHPYNRELRLSREQQEFVAHSLADNRDFLVVDEGPGLSGSSFLSVAEALVNEHVPREKITLICGHEPEFASFRANNGQQRARNFRWIAVDAAPRRPAEAEDFIGGGRWRERQFAEPTAWPESWMSFERLKYLSSPRDKDLRLFKFAGFGRYGDEVLRREQRVAEAGFGLQPRGESHGFISYPWLSARPMSAEDLNKDVVRRLAEYCAFRANAFPANNADLNRLREMAEHNLAQLGIDLPVAPRCERAVIADGRMQPHEWLLTPAREMLKTDSGSHGDDHFFPGATDIAWDLAGAIVEWRMNHFQADALLADYQHLSGDDAAERINSFLVAYTAFRGAYCLMAANALHGMEEQHRLEASAEFYSRLLAQRSPALAASS